MRFGVDEAGKGPVLGSMFAAAVSADPEAIPGGVADSKRLTAARREELAAALREDPDVRVGITEIPPQMIDDPETDMNTLTVRAHAEALSQIVADGIAGLLDAGDTDEARFAARVRRRIDADVHLDAEHGADDSDDLVAAASVVAKVERDAHVEALAASYGADLGSGYPSDETTIRFLTDFIAEEGELPDCARSSWSTSQRLLAEAEQSGLDQF
ncbi:ribonuclease HII [Halanaeroarchaeum sulfurireducens]|uniref:Ribonuclease HII n=1 Tax=Halanaeroarchaeum sulfurireducens TaxID=1604004 RepID=A0A0F7P7M2_9EURY|nr:ribonuclease HII [Halanaeroarchaeum sulfurireducens]AKH96697.1 ribonuclease HII [Halanaeroarchaeum sulfurireducens]ALG81099.1 ribonuclease HII [Halanaeroarchaeum sulfurireducens]